MSKVDKALATVAQGAAEVGSSDVWKALASSKTLVHAAAGGGLGLVANAGYNYAEDRSGGYMGSALAGAGLGTVGSTAWRAGGKNLFHTAGKKVKQSVATDGGTEEFSVRTYPGKQIIKTDKDGNFDLPGQKEMIRNTEEKLKNMDPGSSDYLATKTKLEKQVSGLDSMQSTIDNRLAQTLEGAEVLRDRYSTLRDNHINSNPKMMDALRAAKQNNSLRDALESAKGERDVARNALNLFKKGRGNLSSEEGKRLRNNYKAASNNFLEKSKTLRGSLASTTEQRATLKSPEMKPFLAKQRSLDSKVEAAEKLIEKFKNSEEGVLSGVAKSINMEL